MASRDRGALQEAILSVVRATSRAHPMTAQEIADQVGTSARRARSEIHELRQQGYPIASAVNGKTGFYWPRATVEAEECSRHLWSRVREIAEVARAFDAAATVVGVRRTRSEQVSLVFGDDTEAAE